MCCLHYVSIVFNCGLVNRALHWDFSSVYPNPECCPSLLGDFRQGTLTLCASVSQLHEEDNTDVTLKSEHENCYVMLEAFLMLFVVQ